MKWRWQRDWWTVFLRLWTLTVFIYLFAPIVTVVVFAFNKGIEGHQSATFEGFTTQWFPTAWDNPQLLNAVGTSVKIAIGTAVLSTVLGTVGGFVMARHRRSGVRTSAEILVYFVLIVPEVVVAVGLLLFYTKLGFSLGLMTLIIGHSLFDIALVALIVRARVVTMDPALEDASADLGATPTRTFFGVVLPQLRPAILAGCLLAFTFSFDDVVTSLFLTTPTVNTLPVYLLGEIQLGARPDVYAIASLMLTFTLTVLISSLLLYRWQLARVGRRPTVLAAQ